MRWVAVLLMLALPAQAQIPLSTLRPLPRPEVAAPPPNPQSAVPLVAAPDVPILRPLPRPAITTLPPAPLTARVHTLRPQPRPASLATSPALVPQPTAQPAASILRTASVNPPPRPKGLVAAALSPAPQDVRPEPDAKPERRSSRRKKASTQGSVCGVAAIKGEAVARISSNVKGCGIAEPVRITSVSGVRLSQPATLDCDTARALNRWVEAGLQPAFGRSEVVEMRIAAHYICRSRNNIKGAKVSEHGRGKAIDIAGVTLENGKTISVLGGYGKELRRAHKAACGIFGTTLGPGSDGFHEDHLHFDTASHRSGTYCR